MIFRHKNFAVTFALLLTVSIPSGSAHAQGSSFSLSKSGTNRVETVASLLWVDVQPPQAFGEKASVDNVERSLFHRSQADLVKSSLVIDQTLKQPGILQLPLFAEEENASAWLQRRIIVSADASSQLMEIGMTVDDPRHRQQVLALVRAVTTAYLQVYHGQLGAERQREGQLLTSALERLDAKRQQAAAADRNSAEAKILNELWTDLYRRSVEHEANAHAGPRIQLLKLAGDGFDQQTPRTSAAAQPVSERTATSASRPTTPNKPSIFSKSR